MPFILNGLFFAELVTALKFRANILARSVNNPEPQ
jgi:hypothetical protein